MAHEFKKILADKGETPGETRVIKPLSSPFSFPLESAVDNLNSCLPFVNDCLNSRLGQALPVGDWIVRSSASLESGLRPKHILHASSDRVIIQGDGPWQLFDKECRMLTRGYLQGSDLILDAENKIFYLTDDTGMIEAHNLADGRRVFSASLFFGHAYYRSFITRQGNRMIVTSIERVINRDAIKKPENSTIEILEFNEPTEIDRDRILRSAKVVFCLKRKTLLLLSALYDQTLVVATDNQICLLDFDLKIKTALNGKFKPLSMSLSNAGIIYLVLSDNGVPKLRAITPKGERLFSAQLPEEMLDITYPPIIGYDHRIFLIKDNFLMVFSRNGLCVWEYKAKNRIAGAVITTENELMISIGSELGVFDANGNYRILYKFKDETLQTPPTLTSTGELIVATDKKLYCLAIRTDSEVRDSMTL